MVLYSPDNLTADAVGLISADIQDLDCGAMVRIYKNGTVRVLSQAGGPGSAGCAELFLEPTGYCYLWNIIDNSYIEMKVGGEVEIKGDPITLTGNVNLNIEDGWND